MKLLSFATVTAAWDLDVLHMNDHHSHIEEETFDLKGEALPTNLSAPVSSIRVKYGGFPRLVSLANKLASNATNVLKLHAGDAVTGTSYYSLFKGKSDAEMMSRVCFDAFCLGNHEFDDGDATLATFIDELQSKASCPNTTAVLAANVQPGPDSPLTGKFVPSTIKVFGDGERVGIVGIDIKSKTELSSSPSPGTTLTDERTAAQAEIDRLTAVGVSKIVLLTHIGLKNDLDWMAQLRGVDIVVGGDSHSLLASPDAASLLGSSADGAYPQRRTNGDGKPVCVVQGWEYGHALGHLTVSFDDAGVVKSCTGQPTFPFDGTATGFSDRTELAWWSNDEVPLAGGAADVDAVASHLEAAAGGATFVAVAADPETTAALAEFSGRVDALRETVIARVPEDICYDRFPGQGRSRVCSKAQTSRHGGGACQLVAEAFLAVTPTADFAVQNGGGCRTDITQGELTVDGAYTLLPFSNTLVTVSGLTGAAIVSLLDAAVSYGLDPDGSSGAYPYAAGLRYAVDASAPPGSRVTGVEMRSSKRSNHAGETEEEEEWVPLDLAKTWTVVTNSYIASGKDGYTGFAPSASASAEGATPTTITKEDTYREYAQAFLDYATHAAARATSGAGAGVVGGALTDLTAPRPEDMSTRAYTNATGHCFSGCDTPAPTAAPTASPTAAPTTASTTAPTAASTPTATAGTALRGGGGSSSSNSATTSNDGSSGGLSTKAKVVIALSASASALLLAAGLYMAYWKCIRNPEVADADAQQQQQQGSGGAGAVYSTGKPASAIEMKLAAAVTV